MLEIDQQSATAALNATSLPIEQAGALCLRESKAGSIAVLLVRSLRTGEWGLPKGHVEHGENIRQAAAREAFEEAGATGAVDFLPFGFYSYGKGDNRRFRVTVHIMEVCTLKDSYPECSLRERGWFTLSEATQRVHQPGIRSLLLNLQAAAEVAESYRGATILT